jgi:hypothetical protein
VGGETEIINESTEENTINRTIDFFANDMFSKTTIKDQYWGIITPYGLLHTFEEFENIPSDIVFKKSKMVEEAPNLSQLIYLYNNYGLDDTSLSKEIIIKYYRLIGNYIDNQNNQINESTEENKDRLYDRVLGILNEPPYVSTLLSMGFNMFQIEEILKLKFQKENIKLDIRSHHNTSTERDFKDLANGEHWLETNVNIDSGRGWENIYFENMHGQWIISRYDKNGNQTYYENWVGFWWKREYNDRGDLISYEDSNGNDTPIGDLNDYVMNESTEKTTLYDRMLPLMNRPYVDFLKKNGFDWDMIESQFEKMYGKDIKQDHYEYNDGTWDYRVRTIDDKLLYYETTKESVIPYWEEVKYPNEKEVWFMDKYDRAWVKKYNDDGKLIFSYGKHSDTWEDSPEEIKNDPFFDKDGTDILNESTEKNVVDNYLMKVAQMIKKPYVYHIKQHSIDRGYYKQILSYIFNKDIHLDISFGQYNVYDPDNGNRIYSEFNDKDGWEYTEYNKYGLSYEENSDGYWREVSYDDNGRIYKIVNSKGEVQNLQPPYGENINESTEKNREIYHQRLAQIVDKPYFKSLRDMGVNFKDWKPTLSILFDRNIILDGVSLNHTRLLDAETGEEIYGEWDYNDGWVFNDYITGEYKNTLPD